MLADKYIRNVMMHLQKNNALKSLLALAIVVAYILAFIPLAHQHDFENELHDEISCEVNNTDACHNFIYHGVKTSDCSDHSHASSAKKQCLSCHSYLSAKKAIVLRADFAHLIVLECHAFFAVSNPLTENSDAYFYLRGPPIV